MAIRARIAAFLAICVCSGAAEAATLHWWRLESNPGFLGDAIGGSALSVAGDAAGGELDGTGDVLSVPVVLPGGDFTVELFAHLDTADVSADALAAYSDPLDILGGPWVPQCRSDALSTQPRELIFGGVHPQGIYLVTSGIRLDVGKDYYVAASYRASGPPEVTFYVKNLTDGGPLQTVVKSHPAVSLIPGSVFQLGGIGANPGFSLEA